MLTFASKSEFVIRRIMAFLDYAIWFLLDPSKFKKIDKSRIKKILLIHMGGIGEVLTSTIILPALKKNFNAEIYYLISPSKKDLLENNPHVTGVLFSRNNFKEDIKIMKKESFDLAFLIHPSSTKLAFACFKAGIPYRIGGFRGVKDGVNFFLTRKMLDLKKNKAIQSNIDMIRVLGLDEKNTKMEMYLSKKNKQTIKSLLKKLKIQRYVVIHPGSSYSAALKYPSRFWPLERFAKVADYLSSKYNLHVVITGGPEEGSLAKDIIGLSKNTGSIINLSEKLSLGETASLVSNALLVVAPSTGIAHIAEALKIPLVHLSGPDGHHWRPKPTKTCIPIEHNEVCSGCERITCRKKNVECMNSITVQEVTETSERFLV